MEFSTCSLHPNLAGRSATEAEFEGRQLKPLIKENVSFVIKYSHLYKI